MNSNNANNIAAKVITKNMKHLSNNNLKKNRQFGLLVGIVLILFAGFLSFRRNYINLYLVVPGLLLIFSGVLMPQWLAPLRKAWEAIGTILGKCNTYLILTIIYFFLLVPIAWLLRLMGKDLLDRKINAKLKSFWAAKQANQEDTMKYQF